MPILSSYLSELRVITPMSKLHIFRKKNQNEFSRCCVCFARDLALAKDDAMPSQMVKAC